MFSISFVWAESPCCGKAECTGSVATQCPPGTRWSCAPWCSRPGTKPGPAPAPAAPPTTSSWDCHMSHLVESSCDTRLYLCRAGPRRSALTTCWWPIWPCHPPHSQLTSHYMSLLPKASNISWPQPSCYDSGDSVLLWLHTPGDEGKVPIAGEPLLLLCCSHRLAWEPEQFEVAPLCVPQGPGPWWRSRGTCWCCTCRGDYTPWCLWTTTPRHCPPRPHCPRPRGTGSRHSGP